MKRTVGHTSPNGKDSEKQSFSAPIHINFVNSRNEKWFFQQIAKAESILANALDRAETFGPFDKRNLKNAITHVSIIDFEMLQLLQGQCSELSEE